MGVKTPSDATNTALEQYAAQRLGIPGAGSPTGTTVSTDPSTGQLVQSTPAQQRVGNLYWNPAKNQWLVYGSTVPASAAQLSQAGVSPTGPANASKNLGLDPSMQLQQGINASLALNPANNATLSAATNEAGQLASGQVGDRLAATVQPSLDATQGRINQQASDLGIVRASAQGTGPSAAENLARAQLDANIRSQSAMAATARGGNIASAMRGAQESGTQQSLQSSATIAAQRAQEQLNAQQLLTTGSNNLTSAQGSLGNQQQNLAQMQGNLQIAGTSGLGNAAGLYANGMTNMVSSQEAARQQYAQYLAGLYATSAGISPQYTGQGVQAQIANQQATMQLLGAGVSAFGAGTAALSQLG